LIVDEYSGAGNYKLLKSETLLSGTETADRNFWLYAG